MSTKRDLLKEAIEDAKAVKETAIANAKAVLEEAFTPHLKSMLAAKLQEMEDEDLDEAKMDDLDEMKDEKELDEASEEIKEEDLINDPKGPTAHGNVAEEEESLDELNLDELLAELEAEEMSEAKKEEDMTEAKKKDEDKKDLKEAEEEVETEEEINIEDMTEEDLKSFIEDVIKDMVEAGELEAGEGMEGEEGEEGGEEEMAGEEEVSIDELLAEIEKEEKMDEAKEGDMDEAYSKMKKDLDEAYKTIESMRKDINEVNLLNAKLLYTNKIFKAKNLTESQKVKVLNAFDKATTVKETKLVYETLTEGLKEKSKSPVNESLKTSLASKVTTTSTAKQPIVEVTEAFKRMQRIAGIIK
jgi:hypothetical protein